MVSNTFIKAAVSGGRKRRQISCTKGLKISAIYAILASAIESNSAIVQCIIIHLIPLVVNCILQFGDFFSAIFEFRRNFFLVFPFIGLLFLKKTGGQFVSASRNTRIRCSFYQSPQGNKPAASSPIRIPPAAVPDNKSAGKHGGAVVYRSPVLDSQGPACRPRINTAQDTGRAPTGSPGSCNRSIPRSYVPHTCQRYASRASPGPARPSSWRAPPP